MFDENKNTEEFDLMMKSILDEGTEEVPSHVWEGVSAGLDNLAKRKTVVLWWRRTAVGIAAAAALAIGVVFNGTEEQTLVPEAGDSDLIAVVEPVQVPSEPETVQGNVVETETKAAVIPVLIAEADEAVKPSESETAIKNADEAIKVFSDVRPEDKGTKASEVVAEETVGEYFPEDWGEEESKRKRDVSLVLSGIASTNSTQNQNRLGPMKAPSVNPAPQKTGITETSTKSSYGIPVSFGAGVKIGLSPRWSLGAGVNYTMLTRKFYGRYTLVNENGGIDSSTSSDIRNTQHYIGIPVNAYYNIVNKDRINLYAYAGGVVEKCISDNYSVINTSINHKEQIKGVQLSANAGIGVEFMLGNHVGIYLDPSIRYYFDCNQPKSIRTVQPLMVGFEMGIRARL